MTLDELIRRARMAVITIGADQRPIEHIGDWNHYQLGRGVLELLDTARSSTGPVNVARLRALLNAPRVIEGGSELVQLQLEAVNALGALLDVFDAACSWRDERCSKLSGCDMFDGSHDNDCEINLNMRRLSAAVDKARGA